MNEHAGPMSMKADARSLFTHYVWERDFRSARMVAQRNELPADVVVNGLKSALLSFDRRVLRVAMWQLWHLAGEPRQAMLAFAQECGADEDLVSLLRGPGVPMAQGDVRDGR